MDGKTNGGVFSPQNLHLFSYTRNNPVNLVDPNGEFAFLITLAPAIIIYFATPDGIVERAHNNMTRSLAIKPNDSKSTVAGKTLIKAVALTVSGGTSGAIAEARGISAGVAAGEIIKRRAPGFDKRRASYKKFNKNWNSASLREVIKKFEFKKVGASEDSVKIIYRNKKGMELRHDIENNYFRIRKGKQYLDEQGHQPRSPRGVQGNAQKEYNQATTHIKNTD